MADEEALEASAGGPGCGNRRGHALSALYMSKLAETAERYGEMVNYVEEFVACDIPGDNLQTEERNLISIAFKNEVSELRNAWRVIASRVQEERDPSKKVLLQEYLDGIAEELCAFVKRVQKIADLYTVGKLKAVDDPEMLVFFHKMMGDHHRYAAEVLVGDARAKRISEAEEAYQAAQSAATLHLATTNPIRLGLALNLSVFYYELKGEEAKATELAQASFDNAIDDLDKLGEEAYRDSTLIMQLIKDNLGLWSEAAAM